MRLVLMGPKPSFAPETDEGTEFDDADDDTDAAAEDSESDEDPEEPDDAAGDEDPDEEDEADLDPDVDPEPRPTRGATRIQTLAAERAAEKVRADRAEAELAELRRTRDSQETAAAHTREAERLASLTPEERIAEQVNQRLARIEFTTWDSNDQVAFSSLTNSNPAVAAVKDEVETLFKQQVAMGKPTDRQTIAAFVIGQRALQRAPAAKRKGAKAAADSKAKNTARSASGRGDVPAARQRGANDAAARKRRLENVEI